LIKLSSLSNPVIRLSNNRISADIRKSDNHRISESDNHRRSVIHCLFEQCFDQKTTTLHSVTVTGLQPIPPRLTLLLDMALCSSRLRELTSLCSRLPPSLQDTPTPSPSALSLRNSALLQHLSRILLTMSGVVTDLEKTISHKGQVQTGGGKDLATLLNTYTQVSKIQSGESFRLIYIFNSSNVNANHSSSTS
jgi:hypothetical protein